MPIEVVVVGVDIQVELHGMCMIEDVVRFEGYKFTEMIHRPKRQPDYMLCKLKTFLSKVSKGADNFPSKYKIFIIKYFY